MTNSIEVEREKATVEALKRWPKGTLRHEANSLLAIREHFIDGWLARAQVEMVVQPEAVDDVIASIDNSAQEYCVYDYGLPVHDEKFMESARTAIRELIAKAEGDLPC